MLVPNWTASYCYRAWCLDAGLGITIDWTGRVTEDSKTKDGVQVEHLATALGSMYSQATVN